MEYYVASYLICQQAKVSTQLPAEWMQPLLIPTMVWDKVTMDFITGLPISRGYSDILVVVDMLTKATHFRALSSNFMANKVAELFT